MLGIAQKKISLIIQSRDDRRHSRVRFTPVEQFGVDDGSASALHACFSLRACANSSSRVGSPACPLVSTFAPRNRQECVKAECR